MNGAEIKRERKARALTQLELANMIGVSKSLIAQVETGAKPVSSDVNQKIKAAFDSKPKLGSIKPVHVANLQDESLVLMWKDKPFLDAESHIIRTLARLLMEQRDHD
ncbi:XRE family transcriptional regulator [Lacticaseibacillus paracasei subsp. paracasei Lpp14]|jgi:transcriptional regulator with XRE-family HTH domain|uniref:XRE family transcriptional regulator n=1 Tax=Lacticaseibacillus paracasei subsp. paracasei Lpp14 TaxID=1256204 RepID=A0A829GLG8_LACPA|nr:XRE family transcriptional regulator [Lacticaseibacillus paracasei subsp. paracasei Lpp14]